MPTSASSVVIDDGIVRLTEDLPSRYGTPVVTHVDLSIFHKRYATHCLACGFCADMCCSYGVDVDLLHRDRILARADVLEAFVGVPRERWFQPEIIHDDEMPGGGSVRTRVQGRGCVFLNQDGRGCTIHMFCNEMGIEYQELKSIVDCLFPLTVTDGVLAPADEVDDRTLVCVGKGETLYRGLRDEVKYYFGDAALATLDLLESQSVALMEHDNSTLNSQGPSLER